MRLFQSTQNARPQLYGRSKIRRLRPAQVALIENLYPRISVDPKHFQVPETFQSVSFEIGFGGGEHLIWQARNTPARLHIGAEPFMNGIARVLMGVDEHELENVRLYCGDGRDILQGLPEESLDIFYLLFPDPWPKSRHHKRRIVTPEFLNDVYRVLKPDGIFRFSSDIADYVDWVLTCIHRHGG
ncbi:MAG: tRNA (guanosine(46)-N7)-methyltransferase TrmB, partial [Hyphomonadaceae bacterium]|nr:tRNA (guanosine(46)-N7)-methyltransferase TrmB [Hyphomonadaceae bacterium]